MVALVKMQTLQVLSKVDGQFYQMKWSRNVSAN